MQVKITLDILGWHQRNQLARGRGRRPRLQSNPEKGGEQVSARNRPFTLLLTNASCYPKRLCSGGLLRVMTDPMKGPKRSLCFAILWSVDLQCRPLSFSVVFFFHWVIQLHHLTPNSILHISIFIHLCEAFLGIEPHFNLFFNLFHLKPQPNSHEIVEVGGARL